MDQVTQQTAANAEETASASEELAAQAQTMKEQINLLAIQVGGNGNRKLRKHIPANPKKKHIQKANHEAGDQTQEQQISGNKMRGNIVFKLLLSPIYILKSIVNLRKRNESDKGINSGSISSSETAPDIDNKTGENGNGNGNKEGVLIESTSNDSLIPMGENRIPEHDERFKDF